MKTIILSVLYSCYILLKVLPEISTQNLCRGQSQEEITEFNGYIKYLNNVSFYGSDSISTLGYIHNRLNYRIFNAGNLSGALEIRNRIYYGQQVQNTPGFGKLIDNNNEDYDLSVLIVDENSVVFLSMIDRLWIDWTDGQWEVRAGRQRINWGRTVIWNPNDLFNTYNYFNFDYIEQPGSDALRVSFFPSGMSLLEFAIKPGRKKDETVAAGMWRFNQWNYDFQFLTGLYYTDYVLGTGWAGNIFEAGFKGEATWFQPKTTTSNEKGILSAALSLDYSFSEPVYIQGGMLYNSHPEIIDSSGMLISGYAYGGFSAKNLMPSDWSFFGQVNYIFNPLLFADLSVIYSLDPEFFYTMPSVTYSLSANWDISLIQQGIYYSENNSPKPFNSIYLRLMWSF